MQAVTAAMSKRKQSKKKNVKVEQDILDKQAAQIVMVSESKPEEDLI